MLLVISYHYYQNKSTISQTRSLTLNSYKPEKMACQCVDVISKFLQHPIVFVGISATKFVPSKESGSFLKFFQNVKPKDKEVTLDSFGNVTNSNSSNSKVKEELPLCTIVNGKEVSSLLKTEKQKPQRIEEPSQKSIKKFIVKNNEEMMKGSKNIVNNLNTSAEDSPTSKRVSKLIQVCNERDKNKTRNKRLSGVVINNNDFQDSFFMNIYKTEEKKCYGNMDESANALHESKCRKQLIASDASEKNVDDENIDDYSVDLRLQRDACEIPSTSRMHTRINNNNEEPTDERNERTFVQEPLVRLQEIFPDLDDIDSDILSMLPADLQEQARLYMKSQGKKQENVKVARELSKTRKGRPSKAKLADKKGKRRSPLYNFLIKTNSGKHDVPLERCIECGQMIPVKRFSEHMDFHIAQNLYREINKPTSGENGTKRKLEDDEVVVAFVKRQTSNICEPDKILDQ